MKQFQPGGISGIRRSARRLGRATGPSHGWLGETFSWLLPEAGASIDYPPAPKGMLIHVVGDIHGRSDLLSDLFDEIDRDIRAESPQEAVEVYLGDYVDRGPDSARVLDRLLRRGEERRTVFLRGNHEKVFEDFLAGQTTFEDWRAIGGLETLASYELEPELLRHSADDEAIRKALNERMPAAHLSFLRELKTYWRQGAYFFVHAGVRPGIALDKQRESDCLWLRDDFLEYEGDLGGIVVHGHSPVSTPEFLGNRINLDTAAYATGHLSCLKISDRGASLLAG